MGLGLLSVFGAGLLTFVTPCVLPLIPIYLSALIGGNIYELGPQSRGQLMLRSLLFSAGFILVFTLMGLTASSIGSLLSEHKDLLQIAGALLILAFGLKFLGLIHIPFMDRIIRADDRRMQTRFGGINALVMGIVFAAGWSPCVGPVLGTVLTYTASTTSDPATGGLYLGVYGLGFALPLIATAAFAEAGVKFLRRVNPYLPKIERAIGIFLIAISASLLIEASLSDNSSGSGDPTTAAQQFIVDESGQKQPAMLELYSADCTVCKRMAPIVDSLTSLCDGQSVLVRKADVSQSENRHLVKEFRLVGVPTFLFLDENGNEVARLVGEQSEASLKQALSALRGQPCPGLGKIPAGTEGTADTYDLSFPTSKSDASSCDSTEAEGKEKAEDCDQ